MRPAHYFSQSLNTRATVTAGFFSKSVRSITDGLPWSRLMGHGESHRSVTVQGMVSGMKSEQASNVYLFGRPGKAILSEYSPIHVP